MTKDKPAPAQQTKTAEAAPLQPTELEVAEGDYYRYLERLGAPSAQKVALAVFRELSVAHFAG